MHKGLFVARVGNRPEYVGSFLGSAETSLKPMTGSWLEDLNREACGSLFSQRIVQYYRQPKSCLSKLLADDCFGCHLIDLANLFSQRGPAL